MTIVLCASANCHRIQSTDSRGNRAVGTLSSPRAEQTRSLGSIIDRDKSFLSAPKRPDRFLGPPSLPFSGYRVFVHQGQSCRDVKLTTNRHLVPVPGMRGAISLLTHMRSWRTQEQLYRLLLLLLLLLLL